MEQNQDIRNSCNFKAIIYLNLLAFVYEYHKVEVCPPTHRSELLMSTPEGRGKCISKTA